MPYLTLAEVVAILGRVVRIGVRDTVGIVCSGLLIALVVLVAEATIDGESSTRLAQLGTQLQELVETEGVHIAPIVGVAVRQCLMWLALLCVVLVTVGVALASRLWVVALV